MHSDVTKIISESQYRGHTIKIVEREKGRTFLYFYVTDSRNHPCGGMYHYGYSDISEKDLSDIKIAIPKIQNGIDANIDLHEKYEKEKAEKKQKMNWTGRRFKRGDFVHFKGDEKYPAEDTYVWTHFGHHGLEYYIIEHSQGIDRINFINKPPYKKFGLGADGFEAIHSSQLNEGLKYIAIYPKEFQGETDELIMIKEAE